MRTVALVTLLVPPCVLLACTDPTLDDARFPCTTDGECTAEYTCVGGFCQTRQDTTETDTVSVDATADLTCPQCEPWQECVSGTCEGVPCVLGETLIGRCVLQ